MVIFLKYWKDKRTLSLDLYPAKLSFKCEGIINIFKAFVTQRPTLKTVLEKDTQIRKENPGNAGRDIWRKYNQIPG